MKKNRILLPIIAFSFALSAALATGIKTTASFINEAVVIDGDDECFQVGNCTNPTEGPLCENSEKEQLDVRQSLTSCIVPAKGTFTPLH